MHKTTVYLPESAKRRLARMARSRGASEASLIRAAVEALLEDATPRPALPLFHSGDPILPNQVDELLREAFGRHGVAG